MPPADRAIANPGVLLDPGQAPALGQGPATRDAIPPGSASSGGIPPEAGLDGDQPRGSRPRQALRGIATQPGLAVSILIIVVVLAWAARPSLFTGQDPDIGVPLDNFRAPSASHWFGTDSLGRDLYARVIYGSRLALEGTLVATLIGLVAGSVLGLLAGFLRGAVDAVIMRIVDILLAIPGFLLSLALITALGFGSLNAAVAVGLGSIASFARIMRAEVVRVSSLTFVEASHVNGARWHATLRRHVLPNSAGPVLSLAALEFGSALLAISGLSFLGFGAPPPAPEWGSLVSDGRDFLATAWWLTTLPGLVVLVVVLSANRISKALEGNRE